MFNKRWKRILLWTLSIIVVLGVGGLFAANYAVDKLMNSMADGFDVESEDVGGVVQNQGTVTEDVAATNTNTPATDNKDSSDTGSSGKDTTATTTDSNPTKPTKAPASDKAGASADDGYTAQVSTEKAKQIKDSVSIKDKADVISIVLGQLSASDINRLKDLAAGGLNLDEKKEARSIILGKVSEAQYNELSQIAKKYGVSQGKSRAQILKEEQSPATEKGSE